MTKPLRIGLIMQGGKDWIGGSQYIKNIIFALSSLPKEVRETFEICLICNKSFDLKEYETISDSLNHTYYLESELEPFTIANRLRWLFKRKFYKQVYPRFDEFIARKNIDFLYPYFINNKLKSSYKSATWIADFQHKYLPDFFTSQELNQRDESISLIANQASTIVVSSKAAESDLIKFFPEAQGKSKVLTFKTSLPEEYFTQDAIAIQNKYHLPDHFLIVCNQFWQHKNHKLIFQALKLLHQQSIFPKIVCTGHLYDGRQPDYINDILQSTHQLGISNQIYLLGLIPRFDQIQLMRCSQAVIQPSLFEGWSTVVEDARCLGKSMILSDIPVHLEQNPPNSIYFKRNSADDLAAAIAQYWEHPLVQPSLEQEAIARAINLKQVQKFGDRFLAIAHVCSSQ